LVSHGKRKNHFLPELSIPSIYHRRGFRPLVFYRDICFLEHLGVVDVPLLQNGRKGVGKSSVALLCEPPRRTGLSISCSKPGFAFDDKKEAMNELPAGDLSVGLTRRCTPVCKTGWVANLHLVREDAYAQD
jgi:hypothetical protein